ncbi:N-acyl-D-amino-acid deacylase family protein [Microlunatus elymi]|nr:amidohydrolase family protein [Microlunatus elymi]
MTILISGGTVVDPFDGQFIADVLVDGDRVVAIGRDLASARRPDQTLDASGLLIMPGGIDAHSHTDARILDEDVQLALLRSGVTTVITGQDGVSFAPGDGRYAADYFGSLNGAHPSYRGDGVAGLLRGYDGRTRLNVGYLLPAGTIRYEVMGRESRRPSADELATMIAMVEAGLTDGALGLSSGLDYVPGTFADVDEFAALCAPVAATGGVFVSHIRGYEENAGPGVAELVEICRRSGVAGHVSHFHARPELIKELLDRASGSGVELTWDAYPYFRGFTLLSMVLLPPELIMLGNAEATARLRDPAERERLTQGFEQRVHTTENLGDGWADRVRIADAGTPGGVDLDGLTLAEAGDRRGLDPLQLGYQVLADSELMATTVMEIPKPRTDDQLARQFALPAACSGSDGIFLGGSPHPRGFGCLARMYGVFGRQRRDFDWPQLSMIGAGRAASRFGLGDRGRVRVGGSADLVLMDPERITDRADYAHPRRLSEGIDRVLVRGRLVLDGGELTDDLAGGSVRPSPR